MSRTLQFVIIICSVALITAVVSHSIITWLGIETTFGRYWVTGPGGDRPSVFMSGSSLAGDGLSWRQIASVLGLRIEGWGVAGSSPCEWEQYQKRGTQTMLTVVVVSSYDMNEYFLSDFRAEVVPLGQTIKDLRQSRSDWYFSERLLSLYPLAYLRKLFPTAGRSEGVMVGVREKLKKLAASVFPMASEAGPTLASNETFSTQEYKTEKISDWTPGRTLRRLASIHSACQGKHAFNGPKRLAFQRMLRKAQEQGQALVVVLPVSPVYSREFLTPEVQRAFEEVIVEEQLNSPQIRWARLDQIDELNSNEHFWDLVHLNSYGQHIATEVFLGQLKKSSNLL